MISGIGTCLITYTSTEDIKNCSYLCTFDTNNDSWQHKARHHVYPGQDPMCSTPQVEHWLKRRGFISVLFKTTLVQNKTDTKNSSISWQHWNYKKGVRLGEVSGKKSFKIKKQSLFVAGAKTESVYRWCLLAQVQICAYL